MTPEQITAIVVATRTSDAWAIMDHARENLTDKGLRDDADMALYYIAKVNRALTEIASKGAKD
jgi:hypothetical protein